jgi:hypothetical protein
MLRLAGFWGWNNPALEVSTVLACAGLHTMKALRLTIFAMMISPPKPLVSFIVDSRQIEGPVCAVSRSGFKVHHGLSFSKLEAC